MPISEYILNPDHFNWSDHDEKYVWTFHFPTSFFQSTDRIARLRRVARPAERSEVNIRRSSSGKYLIASRIVTADAIVPP